MCLLPVPNKYWRWERPRNETHTPLTTEHCLLSNDSYEKFKYIIVPSKVMFSQEAVNVR